MNNMISIIIPAYNAEKYIERSINSVLNQSYPDIELIVVNDGSTDRTSKILESYGDKIRYFYQENRGVASARNLGIEIANGNYIAFLDSDDYLDQFFCERMITNAISSNSDIVVCNLALENVNGNRRKGFNFFRTEKIILRDKRSYQKAFKIFGNSSCNKIFRKSIIYSVRFPNFKIGEDALFVLETLLNSKELFCLNEELYIYFDNKFSVTNAEIDKQAINNYVRVHNLKRELIIKYSKFSELKFSLKDYYIQYFLMYTHSIRKVKNKAIQNILWENWLNINFNDFLLGTILIQIIKFSNNINWVYYAGMILTGKGIPLVFYRIKYFKYYYTIKIK